MPFSRSLTPAWLACVLAIAVHGAEPPEPPQDQADPASADLKQDVPNSPDQAAEAEESETPTVSDERPQPEAETAAAPASTPPAATEPQQLPQPQPQPPAPIIVTPDFSPLVQANANLADRLAAMERMMVAQADREAEIYRDTNRLITIFGISVAALGALALLVAGILNYRLMRALPAAVHGSLATPPTRAPMVLPENDSEVPGMERVRASGQRFQSKMDSLEARLAEMEHLSGIRNSPAGAQLVPASSMEEEVMIEPPPRRERIIPVAGILVHKAETLLNLGKHDQALTVLDQALEAGATGPEVHLARGRVFERVGKFSEALREYDAALNGEGNNTSALLLKAGVLNRQERFEEALACYERAIAANRASN